MHTSYLVYVHHQFVSIINYAVHGALDHIYLLVFTINMVLIWHKSVKILINFCIICIHNLDIQGKLFVHRLISYYVDRKLYHYVILQLIYFCHS